MRPIYTVDPRPMITYTTSSTTSSPDHSSMHSPVPYLFGGVAAMFGLIAFALLILACSYCKLSAESSSSSNNNNGNIDRSENDIERGEEKDGEKVLVIMAGNQKPTFLATPTPVLVFTNNKGFSDHCLNCNKNENINNECSSVKDEEGEGDVKINKEVATATTMNDEVEEEERNREA